MADLPIGPPPERAPHSLALDLAVLLVPFLLLAALLPLIDWGVDALFALIG
ncbi:hypothetical protein [Phenylobacterium sp.]|uniref:hypothetical protein n=1 Tax=Phenylobacterium sp. TaxID=1871053 RepID=UPI0035B1A6A5